MLEIQTLESSLTVTLVSSPLIIRYIPSKFRVIIFERVGAMKEIITIFTFVSKHTVDSLTKVVNVSISLETMMSLFTLMIR